MVIKSMMPLKSLPKPIGIWIAMAFAPRRARSDLKLKSKSAPSLSILLIKHMRGTP